VNVHSLRFRLIWIHSAAIAIVIVCFGMIRYHQLNYRTHKNFDDSLVRDARFFVSHLERDQYGLRVSIEALQTADALAILELERCLLVTDVEGRVLSEDLHGGIVQGMLSRGELKEIIRQKDGFETVTAQDGSSYRFLSLPVPNGTFLQPAVAHVGRSMESHRGALREYMDFYIFSVPLILAISVALGWFLAGRALKPFEEITRTAERITHQNLNMQIVTTHREEEVQRLVQSFNSMVQRLDKAFRQMRKFNADAAHELRTPLSILQGENEVALRSPTLSEEVRLVLASNLEELDRLARIVNDLLTLSEAEAGRQVLVWEPLDAQNFLEDLVDQMKLLASDRNLRIELRCEPGLWINADKLWIRRAILNLLDNAIKYSRDGGLVIVSSERENSTARLKVRDDGIGILPHDLPHIFDRLYRADPARSRDSGGVGLGLALVKWIVEVHGGTIHVESEPDHGALFEIRLPACLPPATGSP
jgi:heavy metal sensor kinase